MAGRLTITVRGDEEYVAALRRIRNPRVLIRPMKQSGAEVLREMRRHVSGPRPRRLDRVTGELARSFAVDARQIPRRIRSGTPLPWPQLFEDGTAGRPRRPFAEPGLDVALKRIPGFFVDALERARDGGLG